MSDIKTFKVCLSSNLPGELQRKFSEIYFVYDKMELYCGPNLINENFALVQELPENPVEDMLYIFTSNGSIHRITDYEDVIIANIDNPNDVEILQKVGTTYYVDANRSYIDKQRRVLTLPFNDGEYELNISTKNDILFDNDTIAKYNPSHGRFELYGDDSAEFIDYSKPFRGATTPTIETRVDGPRVSANVRISKALNNILKASSDGLFVRSTNLVKSEVFEQWKSTIDEFKQSAQDVLDRIDTELSFVQNLITQDSLNSDIRDILNDRYGDIDQIIGNYNDILDRLDTIQDLLMSYTITTIQESIDTLNNELSTNSNWQNLDSAYHYHEQEVNYFDLDKDWNNGTRHYTDPDTDPDLDPPTDDSNSSEDNTDDGE